MIYPGREHVVLGATESGKSWYAVGCTAAELIAGNRVSYIHYEEPDAGSTLERLKLMGVPDHLILSHLKFIAPQRAVWGEWLQAILDPAPSLVVHDGVNQAMSLHGDDILAAEGAALFRAKLIVPCQQVGAATLACDHLPLAHDGTRVAAYGSVHKGNALDGARILVENLEPFGRRMRGVSLVFVTKDRPGHLRANGRPTKTPEKTFMGALIVDDSQAFGPDFELAFIAPKDDPAGEAQLTDRADELADAAYVVLAALPDRSVDSLRKLYAHMRAAGHKFTEAKARAAVDDLEVRGRVVKRGKGYRAMESAAEGESA